MNVSGWGTYHLKSFSLSREDAQDKDDWRLGIKEETGKDRFSGEKGCQNSTCVASVSSYLGKHLLPQ